MCRSKGLRVWVIIISRKLKRFPVAPKIATNSKKLRELRLSARAKCSLAAIVATLVAGPNLARGEIDPNTTYPSFGGLSLDRKTICFGYGCSVVPGGLSYGATQGHDCNKAGLANPSPVRGFLDSRVNRRALDNTWQQGIIFPRVGLDALNEWPMPGLKYKDTGAGEDPIKFEVGESGLFGNLDFGVGYSDQNEPFVGGSYSSDDFLSSSDRLESLNVETRIGEFPQELQGYASNSLTVAGTTYTTMTVDEQQIGDVILALQKAGITNYTYDVCRQVLIPTDPNYLRTGRNGGNSWGEKEDDQWAIKRAGFTADEYSAWNQVPDSAAPVIVAVIDTGLDWHHLDINAENIWRNLAEDPNNGVDDDSNGYVDDVIGWDFLAKNNRPWDFDGHGTVVTGIIAAAHNDFGIAGINPHVKIMVLKAVNNFGTTRASYLADAIVYAVDNGAQVINISVGGETSSRIEQAAIEYAYQAGVLIVAAAGNNGIELGDFGPGGNDYVLTVGATHVNDRAAGFSNFGAKIDLVAPGVDVLSLRARYTDANYRPSQNGEGEYAIGDNYVGDDKRYLHVSGTSFSTPIVAGTASLLLSKDPTLTASSVRRILLETATDIEFPGKDPYTGHGMINATAALSVDGDFSVTAEISQVELTPAESPLFARVYGTIDATRFKRAWMQIGSGENPGRWRFVGPKRKYPIIDGELGLIPIRYFDSEGRWQVVINVEHHNGVIRRAAFPLTIR